MAAFFGLWRILHRATKTVVLDRLSVYSVPGFFEWAPLVSSSDELLHWPPPSWMRSLGDSGQRDHLYKHIRCRLIIYFLH